jgi:hypothetical protein
MKKSLKRQLVGGISLLAALAMLATVVAPMIITLAAQ